MNPTEQTEAAPIPVLDLSKFTPADYDRAQMKVIAGIGAESLLAAGTLNGTANVTKPETGIREHVAADALRKLVREFATDIREKGYSIADLKFSPEWQESRALYFVYCGGFEDALYESRAVLAAAVRADKPAWVGDVVLHAWYEYADDGIEKMIAQEQP